MPEVHKFNKPPFIRQWPFPLTEAADIVLAHLDSETKAVVVMTPRENLAIFRATIGQWIMDSFGMRQSVDNLKADQEWISVLGVVWDRLYTGDSD